ncbi:MAG TPA: histone deacetylase [Longimicrobiales bacterium]|nr:histone deacetylase [Longimicrobiales bacterium]
MTGSGAPQPTALILHGDCGLHDTGWGHPEHQGRLPGIVHAIYKQTPALLDHVLQHEARPADDTQLLRVHTPEHIELIRTTAARAEQSGQIIRVDADTALSGASADAAAAAAGCAIDAVRLVMTGRALTAMALCRPPGHHATPDRAMGFCLFNNAAVAARAAQAEHGVERVLIIDWDVHHGNGTQDAFFDDPRVFYLSLHIEAHYPGTGAADETGVGAGAGTTLNVPLPAGMPAADYRRAFSAAVREAFEAARPQLVIISAGYDCLAGDPLGGLLLEPADIHAMTREVMEHAQVSAAGRIAALLEGGYVPKRAGAGVVATLRALAGLEL